MLKNKLKISGFKGLRKSEGFTLVELLIVIAIIGVLAGVLLVALNPFEQFARARDTGRIAALNQFGKATTQFFVSHGGIAGVAANSFPGSGTNTWYVDLTTTSNEVNANVTLPVLAGAACNVNPQVLGGGTMCYKIPASNADAVLWTRMESQNEIGKIAGGCTNIPVFVYFYSTQKVQVDCLATVTTVPTTADTGLGNP